MALKDVMRRFSGTSRVYAVFTIVDAVLGTLTFYWSDQAFNVSSVGGNPRVYGVVTKWGALRNLLAMEGIERESQVEIEISATEECVPSNGTTRYTPYFLLQNLKFFDVEFIFYQWDIVDQTQQFIWRGYCRGASRYNVGRDEGSVITLMFSSRGGIVEKNLISDVVTKDGTAIGSTTYPNAPTDSLGKMIPRAFGRFKNEILGGVGEDPPNDCVFLGYGVRGVPGVVVDEQLTDLKAEVRFRVAGTTAYFGTVAGTTDDPSDFSYFWVYIPEGNTYGLIDVGDFTATNDSSKTAITVKLEPIIFAALRPTGLGSMTHNAQKAELYKLTDDDPTNFSESTTTDYRWAINIPPMGVGNLRVIDVRMIIDIQKSGAVGTRDIEFGIWNDFNVTSASWWGNTNKRQTQAAIGTTRTIYYTSVANRYVAGDANHNVGQNASSEFSEGRFVGRDSAQVETPLQAFVNVTSASKDGVRVYGMGVIVKCQVQLDRVRRVSRTNVIQYYDPQGRPRKKPSPIADRQSFVASSDLGIVNERRLDFIWCGSGQKDDGSGTYEGTANAEIFRVPAIAHYLIAELASGETVNTTSGTLGNFVDAKVESVSGEKRLNCIFGTDKFTIKECLEEIQKRHPVRFFKDDGKWQCVYEEMNPHSSRFYRGTSDVVQISAKEHLVGDLQVSAPAFDQIRNRVLLSYGHSYGTNRPSAAYNYSHPLSVQLFGTRDALIADEPWVPVSDTILTVSEAAKFYARYLASRIARPRLRIVVQLTKEFYDLRKGHVLGFSKDMESEGCFCPAYRCGRVDNAFFRTDTSTADQADDTTPQYLPSGSITSETVFCAQQQYDRLSFFALPGTGAYTQVNNGWEYYDGSAWTAFSSVVASDGGDPDDVFKRSGNITVSWAFPSPWLWKKAELTIAGTAYGPGYWSRMRYTTSTVAVNGGYITGYPGIWAGRLFEVIEVSRKLGSVRDYPIVEAVLQEVM